MDQILGPLQPQCAIVNIDNITIFSKTMEQHLVDVETVIEKLAKAYLKINVDKCSFAQDKVQVLGHIVSREGVKTNPTLVEGIRQKAPPTNITKVQGFLEMANFYRKFIPNFAEIAEPLNELTQKKSQGAFSWGNWQQELFNKLKAVLINNPMLQYLNMNKVFSIKTDASNMGIGAVLSQDYKIDGEVHHLLIAYTSCTLTLAEWNYITTN